MTHPRHMAAAAASALALAAAGAAHAGAFYLQEQSVRGAGRAYSGEVADTGSASLWWNPAAIGGMTGGDAAIGLSAVLPRGDVDNVGSVIVRPAAPGSGTPIPQPVGGNPRTHDPIDHGYLPSGAVAWGLGSHLAVGLAVTSPYSFTTNYPSDSWARYTADKTKLRTIDLQPTVALAFGGLRVGAGLNVEHVKASLSNYLPNLSPLLPDGHQTLSGHGWDVGFSAGAQFAAGPLTLGASYKSSVKHKLDGSVSTDGLLGPLAAENGTVPTTASFRTPWQIDAGARFALSSALTLDGEVNRIGWHRFDAIRLGDPLNVAIPENYRSTWSAGAGLDYQLTAAWTLRGGIQRDLTPTRDGERDARVPDGNRWNYALGTSLKLGGHLTIDAAANYLSVADATIDQPTAAYAGTPAQTVILPHGMLDHARVIVLALGGRLSF